jgi:hypothetical protein
MNSLDSSFYYNSDTIYVQLLKKGKLIIEGKKLPRDHAIGPIKFYRNNSYKLAKIEYWGRESEVGEFGFIFITAIYHGNICDKKIERELDVKSESKVCIKETIYKRDRNNFKWVLKRTTYRKWK